MSASEFIDSLYTKAARGNARQALLPCTLVYLDEQAKGSPNFRGLDSSSYIAQSVTLNRSLLAVGLPRLTVVTNAPEAVRQYLSCFPVESRPLVLVLRPSLELSRQTTFYAAHYKLDLLEQMASTLLPEQLLMLLDTDVVAMRPLGVDLLRQCQATGVGGFDISDQEFSAYGVRRVVTDLELVAGRRLRNPRWYGGEFLLLASGTLVQKLMPVARACFERYRSQIPELNHQGDEVFISAALNIISDEGQVITEVGAHRAVGRHWSGNTHRELRWFKGCALLHLPDRKTTLAAMASQRSFSVSRVWRSIVFRHQLNRIVWAIRVRRASGFKRLAPDRAIDVLLLEGDAGRLSALARALTSRGLVVMCGLSGDVADAVQRLRPRVVVVGADLSTADVTALTSYDEQFSMVVTDASAASANCPLPLSSPWPLFQRTDDVSLMVDVVTEAARLTSVTV